jgi:hypothetical protein
MAKAYYNEDDILCVLEVEDEVSEARVKKEACSPVVDIDFESDGGFPVNKDNEPIFVHRPSLDTFVVGIDEETGYKVSLKDYPELERVVSIIGALEGVD